MGEEVSPLARLIEEVRAAFFDEHGVSLSYADIARRGGAGDKNVHRLATREIKDMPSAETLKALAKGLGVPYSVVLEKALLSAGYTRRDRQPPERGDQAM